MKGVVAMVEPSSYAAAYEDQRTRFKHHNLIKDYQELHQNAEAMKERLQMMKQKRSNLMAEVRFLRRRYKYLLGNQSMNPQPKQDVMQRHNSEAQRTTILKKKSSNKKESDLPFPALDLNHEERISHGMGETLNKFAPKFDLNHRARALSKKSGKETALPNRAPKFDLNHKARALIGKEAALQNPIPKFDLNQKERIQSGNDGNESTKRKSTPVFDLNEISREEEEFEANCEPLRIDEPNKSILRGENDEQHNDMKLLVCRNSGNGSNRSGKRKITWQDQVALRV